MSTTDPNAPALLGDTLAALLDAVADAERQLAASTIDFIEQVGFRRETDSDGRERRVVEMIDFQYQKLDENRQRAWFKLSIPLLGMVNVPLVGIKSAVFSFSYDVTGQYAAGAMGAGAGGTGISGDGSTRPSGSPGASGGTASAGGTRPSGGTSPAPSSGLKALASRPGRIQGRIVRPTASGGVGGTGGPGATGPGGSASTGTSSPSTTSPRTDAGIDIRIEFERVALPVGLDRLFDMIELAVGDQKQAKLPGGTPG